MEFSQSHIMHAPPSGDMSPALLTMDQEIFYSSPYGIRLNPYFLAEQLPHESIIDTPLRPSPLSDTWRTIELALSYEHTPKNRLDPRIEDSYIEAQNVARGNRFVEHRLQARMLIANLGLLALRAHREIITAEDIALSYGIAAQAIAHKLGKNQKSPGGKGILAELVTYGLIARAADPMNTPFVGSLREEASPWAFRNHDLYTLDDARTIKTAIQVRFRKHRPGPEEVPKDAPIGSFVHVHYCENFISEHSAKLTALAPSNDEKPAPKTFKVARLMAEEVYEPYPTGSPEEIALSSLSGHMIDKLNTHRRRLLGLEAWPGKGKPDTIRAIRQVAAPKNRHAR